MLSSFYSPLSVLWPFKAASATQNGKKSKKDCVIRGSSLRPLTQRLRTVSDCADSCSSPFARPRVASWICRRLVWQIVRKLRDSAK